MAGEWKYLSVSNVAVPVLGGTPDKSEPEYWGEKSFGQQRRTLLQCAGGIFSQRNKP